jgi:hypothetical protein
MIEHVLPATTPRTEIVSVDKSYLLHDEAPADCVVKPLLQDWQASWLPPAL